MNERAIAVDGTAIEFARMKLGRRGVELQERAPSGQQSQKSQKGQKGKQSQKSSGGGGSERQDEEVVVVFNEDVPPGEREEVREELDNLETTESSPSGGKQGQSSGGKNQQSGGGKQGQSGGQSRSRGSYRTVGFVPYDRLMYVVPEDLTYNVRA